MIPMTSNSDYRITFVNFSGEIDTTDTMQFKEASAFFELCVMNRIKIIKVTPVTIYAA